jgi:predicted metal-binding protein
MATIIGELAKKHGFVDFKLINPAEIVTGSWVRTKCTFGCTSYGRKACCPPQLPSPGECRNLFDEYNLGLFFHLTKALKDPKARYDWSRDVNPKALAFERDVFLMGFPKAFIFLPAPCNICDECKSEKCQCGNPSMARPTLEAYCVDVFATAQKFGYPIQVLKGYGEEMNRYGALLIE